MITMALLLAFTGKVKAKAAMPLVNEMCGYCTDDNDYATDFELVGSGLESKGSNQYGNKKYEISQMTIDQEIEIHVNLIGGTMFSTIYFNSDHEDIVSVKQNESDPKLYKLKANKASGDYVVTINVMLKSPGIEIAAFAEIVINSVVANETGSNTSNQGDDFTVEITENPTSITPNWKSLEEKGGKLDHNMTIGRNGVDFKITPTTLTPEITPSDSTAISITKKGDGVWHIKANQEAQDVKVTIKVGELEKSFTIKEIKKPNNTGSGGGSSGTSTDKLNETITELETKNNKLEEEKEQLSKENDSLKEQLTSKEKENNQLKETIERRKKYDFEEIDLVYTALIAFGATLLLSILVFVIIHNKKKRSLVSDLYNANYQITTLEEMLKNVQTNNIDTNNSKVKVYENENIKLKKELEDARMDLYKLQQQQQTTPPSPAPAPTPAPEPVPTPTQISVEPEPPLSVFLYADNIIDGCLNKVVNMPDIENTIYELVLDNENASTARVRVYDGARPRILRYPTFLEGCEMQILNSNGTIVDVVKEGVATKDNNGNWVVTTPPMIEIR